VIAFARGDRFRCIVNFGLEPVGVPVGADVLLVSAAIVGNALPQDTTAWLVQAADRAPFDPEPTRTEHNTHLGEGEEGQ
jgi:alpha-glucosidase